MRTHRGLDAATKQRISQSLRGRGKTESHREAISAGMKKYWATIPSMNVNNKEGEDEKDM